jgi:hypothetical protein
MPVRMLTRGSPASSQHYHCQLLAQNRLGSYDDQAKTLGQFERLSETANSFEATHGPRLFLL